MKEMSSLATNRHSDSYADHMKSIAPQSVLAPNDKAHYYIVSY